MKKLVFILALLLTPLAHAQTIHAASCSQADVETALASVVSGTTLVVIPGGTCSWASALAWTVPAGNTNLTIQGATTITFSGTPGTSSYACSVNDGFNATCSSSGSGGTVIADGAGSGNNLLAITANGASSLLTLANLTFDAGTAKNDGIVVMSGPDNNLRWTQIHIVANASQSGSRFFGAIQGVIDHSIADLNGNTTSNGFIMSNTPCSSPGFGDCAWTAPTGFGTSAFIFMENDIVNGGLFEDCDSGGRFVVRYSSYINGSTASAGLHTHGTKTGSGRLRSCRAYELYHVYIEGPTGGSGTAISSNGGPSLVWGNTLGGNYGHLAGEGVPRNDTEINSPTPGSWGYCGTTVNGNGVGSAWDGNSNVGTGYPCLDGLGRGAGQALNGQNFPTAGLQSTGSPGWPQQSLDPIYFFMNSFGATPEFFFAEISSQLNRDVYLDNASFNGTTGTGYGLASARPSTCAPGPGGTYGASSTGSYGVAYFATDANGGQGELYVCTSTNTWTPVYQPYTYPHPLDGGTAGVSLTVNIVGTGTVSGPNCASGSYPINTGIGTCTETPGAGFTFGGWTSTGSASCSGTGTTCGPFNLATTTTLTATFNGTSVCANPTQLPPNYSGTYPQSATPLSIGFGESTPGCAMHMTLDSSTPTCSSTAYTGQNISVTTTMRVIACQSGYNSSAVVGGTWTILIPTPPTITGTTSVTGQASP